MNDNDKPENDDLDDNEVRLLALGLMLILVGLLYFFNIIPAAAQGWYGGPGVIYGPYGPPRRDAYDYPRNYFPPIERPRRYGPQFAPCIGYSDCRGPRRW